jgi:predicted 3-demethylubiquinone-9 3-methyltransferase (glyoxalase superfamily)
MEKITPFLWFDHEAEEAANFYVSVFNGNPDRKKESKIGTVSRYDESSAKASGMQPGSVLIAAFELEGHSFTALNGGPHLKFSGAVSFVIDCKNQAEVDYFWEKLTEGGEAGQCGWINRDKFGLTWQIVPSALPKLLNDPDPEKSGRVMKAMLQMTKINISDLEKAAEQK